MRGQRLFETAFGDGVMAIRFHCYVSQRLDIAQVLGTR